MLGNSPPHHPEAEQIQRGEIGCIEVDVIRRAADARQQGVDRLVAQRVRTALLFQKGLHLLGGAANQLLVWAQRDRQQVSDQTVPQAPVMEEGEEGQEEPVPEPIVSPGLQRDFGIVQEPGLGAEVEAPHQRTARHGGEHRHPLHEPQLLQQGNRAEPEGGGAMSAARDRQGQNGGGLQGHGTGTGWPQPGIDPPHLNRRSIVPFSFQQEGLELGVELPLLVLLHPAKTIDLRFHLVVLLAGHGGCRTARRRCGRASSV